MGNGLGLGARGRGSRAFGRCNASRCHTAHTRLNSPWRRCSPHQQGPDVIRTTQGRREKNLSGEAPSAAPESMSVLRACVRAYGVVVWPHMSYPMAKSLYSCFVLDFGTGQSTIPSPSIAYAKTAPFRSKASMDRNCAIALPPLHIVKVNTAHQGLVGRGTPAPLLKVRAEARYQTLLILNAKDQGLHRH